MMDVMMMMFVYLDDSFDESFPVVVMVSFFVVTIMRDGTFDTNHEIVVPM